METECTNCLGIVDFNDVYVSCESIRSDWEVLATYLGLDRPSVNAIRADGKDVADCLRQAIDAWLRRQSSAILQPIKPCWRLLYDAVSRIDKPLSEGIQRDHPFSWNAIVPKDGQVSDFKDKLASVSSAIETNDVRCSASELKAAFNILVDIVDEDIASVRVSKLRLHISRHFQNEEEKVNEEMEKHLTKIEHYDKSDAVLNYFVRHNFIGYINYSLIKVFQGLSQSVVLKRCVECYEAYYLGFLRFSLIKLEHVFQQCPDLHPDYPAGIPKFTIYLESEWDGRSMVDLKQFLKQCFNDSHCIDQLMIAKISRNCIIVIFAVLPHNMQTVLQYLMNHDVISTLKEEGITVEISQELMKYMQETTQEKKEIVDSITTKLEIQAGLEGEHDLQEQPPLPGILSIKPDWDVTTDTSGYTGSERDIEGAGDQRSDELSEDDLLKEAIDAYEYDRNRLEKQIKQLEIQLQKYEKMISELDQTKDKLQETKLSLTLLQKERDDECERSSIDVGKEVVSLKEEMKFLRSKLKDQIQCHKVMMMDLDEELLVAVRNGNVERVKTLVDLGVDVDITVNNGDTLLHIASAKGRSDIVNVLLSHGATVNSKRNSGLTPLHIASANGRSEVVNILLSHGAIVDIKDIVGRTPLHNASRNGHSDVVNILLTHGATADIKDNGGQAPLHNASINGHSDVVKILMFHGATTDVQEIEGETPLHKAAFSNRDNIVGILLSRGATVNIVDENHQTPLHRCLLNSSHNKVDATVGLLISNGADLFREDKYKHSPICIATVLGQEHLLASNGVSEDTIAKYRLPQGWKASYDFSGKIKFTNTATQSVQYTHPLFQ